MYRCFYESPNAVVAVLLAHDTFPPTRSQTNKHSRPQEWAPVPPVPVEPETSNAFPQPRQRCVEAKAGHVSRPGRSCLNSITQRMAESGTHAVDIALSDRAAPESELIAGESESIQSSQARRPLPGPGSMAAWAPFDSNLLRAQTSFMPCPDLPITTERRDAKLSHRGGGPLRREARRRGGSHVQCHGTF